MKLQANDLAQIGKAVRHVTSILRFKKSGTIVLDFGSGLIVGSDFELDVCAKAPLPQAKTRVTVDAKKFEAITGKLKKETEVELTDELLIFTSGSTTVKLPFNKLVYGADVAEPDFDFSLPAKSTTELLQQALTVIDKKSLSVIEFSVEGGTMRVAATDGYRLLVAETPLEKAVEPFSLLISHEAAKAIVAVGKKEISFLPSETSLSLGIDDSILVSARKSTAKFPNYGEIMQTPSVAIYAVDSGALLESLDRIGVVLDDDNIPLQLTFEDGELRLVVNNGAAEDSLSVKAVDFDSMLDPRTDVVYLRYSHLIELLRLCSGEVSIAISEKTKPILFKNGTLTAAMVRSRS